MYEHREQFNEIIEDLFQKTFDNIVKSNERSELVSNICMATPAAVTMAAAYVTMIAIMMPEGASHALGLAKEKIESPWMDTLLVAEILGTLVSTFVVGIPIAKGIAKLNEKRVEKKVQKFAEQSRELVTKNFESSGINVDEDMEQEIKNMIVSKVMSLPEPATNTSFWGNEGFDRQRAYKVTKLAFS